MHIEFFGVETNSFIEICPLTIVEVHGHINLTQTSYITSKISMVSSQYGIKTDVVNRMTCELDDYREAEEAGPEFGLPVVKELGLCLHESGEEISVSVLILAPVLKVLEDGITLVLRVFLEVPVNSNVPPVTDLL